jgi:hypothetical protein
MLARNEVLPDREVVVRRGTWADEPDRLLAASDHGVIVASALVELGVAESTVYRRCRDGGPWQLLAPGVVALHNGEPSVRQLEIAALLHGGPGAILTGLSAVRHHGLRRGPKSTQVHILVHQSRQVRSVRHIVVERTERMPRAVLRDGLPVAPLARAVLDAVRRLKDTEEIASLLAEPVQRRMLFVEHLRQELDAGCRKGSATPRVVLRAVADGVHSAAEFAAREWWLRQRDLPPARFNAPVLDERGRFIAIVDVLVEELGFAWEIDSVEAHFATPEQVEETARRRRALTGVGLHVLGTRPVQQRDDSAGTRRDVLDALAVAALLPPPRAIFPRDLPESA